MGEFYLRYEYFVAAAQLAFAMIGMGATLSLSDFVAIFRLPRAFATGMLAQLVLIPLLAVAVSHTFGLSSGLAVGLLLVAAVPGGSMSNVFTYLAGGNAPLSIVLTGVTTLACLATTPLVLRLLAAPYLPAEFTMPVGQVAFEIGFCLLLPLGVGMLAGARWSAQRQTIARWCIRSSLLLIGLIIVGAASAQRVDPRSQASTALLAMLVFAFLALQVGLWTSRAARLSRGDRITIAIEVAIRNTNLALLIKASLFPATVGVKDPVADGVLFVALLYGLFALLVTGPAILLYRRT